MTDLRDGMGAVCSGCGAPLAAGQRYCLRCGERHGAPRVDPLATLGFVPDAAPAAAPVAQEAPGRGPSRRVTVALAAATLVMGAVVGAALGPAPAPTLAAAPQRLVALVVPAPAPVVTTPAPAAVDEAPSTPDTSAATPAPAASTAATDAAASTPGSDATTKTGAGDTTTGDDGAAAPAPATAAPAATPHVWIVGLDGLDATTAFGPDSPLADLVARGTLLRGYVPAGPTAAANGLALLGGQVPAQDCAADLAACVLGPGEPSLASQVTTAGGRWRAYVEDPAARCAGPADRVAVSLFAALAQRPDCTSTVVAPDALPADLATAQATPELSLLVPSATGLDASATVHDLVGRITASAAYAAGGLVVLVVDAPPPGGDPARLPATGALVLSPRATAGAVGDTPTGPVALLRSLADLLGVPPLGAAAQAPAGALDGVLAPATATPSSPTPSTTITTTTRSLP